VRTFVTSEKQKKEKKYAYRRGGKWNRAGHFWKKKEQELKRGEKMVAQITGGKGAFDRWEGERTRWVKK